MPCRRREIPAREMRENVTLSRDLRDQPVHVAGDFHVGHMSGVVEHMHLGIAGQSLRVGGRKDAVLRADDELFLRYRAIR